MTSIFMCSYKGGGLLVEARNRSHAERFVRRQQDIPLMLKVTVWSVDQKEVHEYTEQGIEIVRLIDTKATRRSEYSLH